MNRDASWKTSEPTADCRWAGGADGDGHPLGTELVFAVRDASVSDATWRAATEDAVAEIDERARSVAAIDRATATLSERERALLRRRYHDGADFHAIAGELNVSYATVRRNHVGALRRLAAAMAA